MKTKESFLILFFTFALTSLFFVYQMKVTRPRITSVRVPYLAKTPVRDPAYAINPASVCSHRPIVEVVVCIAVARKAFESRQAVRQTWGSTVNVDWANTTVILFFVGTGTGVELPNVQSRIESESKKYWDIVQGDYVDTYRNLTLKSISGLRWVHKYCPNAKFMFKTDVDVYVIMPRLLQRLRKVQNQSAFVPVIIGRVQEKSQVNRNPRNKWHVMKQDFASNTYPGYTLGSGYAISQTAFTPLVNCTHKLKVFWIEDVYITGLCRQEARVNLVHDPSFSNLKLDGCRLKRHIQAHGYSPSELRRIHQSIKTTTRTRNSMSSDWHSSHPCD